MNSLTDVLLDRSEAPLSPDRQAELRAQLEQGLAYGLQGSAACGRLGPRDLVHPRGRRRSFAWSARSASRALGLDALASVVRSPDLGLPPARAVSDQLDRLRRTGGAGYGTSLGTWLGTLSGGACSVVAAEATTWCTRLLCALDWERLGPALEFGCERWWRAGPASGVVLRATADVEVSGGRDGTGPSLLVVHSGCPTPASRLGTAFTGLVGALDQRSPALPGRVVGFWPDCGRWMSTPLDRPSLERTLEVTVRVARRRSVRRRT